MEQNSAKPANTMAMTAPGAFLTSIPMMIITFMVLSQGKLPDGAMNVVAFGITWVLLNTLFFLMVKTGKTDRFRAFLFVIFAAIFSVTFITHYVEARGSMALSESEIFECRTPFCHIVIPMTIIPIAFTRTIIFPGTMTGAYAAIAGMLVLWIGASVSIGRGFCGWACFLGGWDDGFSRVLKRPVIRKIDNRWRYLSFAVLLAIALASAAMLSPTYCKWLCPFKTVTEYVQVTNVVTAIQMIIFLSLFAGLVVILPVLTRRRIQCGLFCPFGAFQSFTNAINIFKVRIDKDLCVKCRKCVSVCPTFSMTESSIESGAAGLTCIKCGKCIDNCPKQALSYHIRGTDLKGGLRLKRILFLYAGFIFLSSMSGSNIQQFIVRMLKLLTTGSMIG